MPQHPELSRIYKGKAPSRRHYIPEWAERRHKTQADVVRGTGADKATVSRWFNEGKMPRREHLLRLAAFLNVSDPPDPEALFRHPDDDWFLRLFHQQTAEMRETIRELMESNLKRRGAA